MHYKTMQVFQKKRQTTYNELLHLRFSLCWHEELFYTLPYCACFIS